MASLREQERKKILQIVVRADCATWRIISTPAGGKYMVRFQNLLRAIHEENSCVVTGLHKVVARKIGDMREEVHFLPLVMSDISPYFEPMPETEPVGCATAEKPSKKLDDHFKRDFDVSGSGY